MRVIEEKMNSAIKSKRNMCNGNTWVVFEPTFNWSEVRLHGHCIAVVDWSEKSVSVSSCGWHTVTTKSRINAVLNGLGFKERVSQKNFEWSLGDKKFYDGIKLFF